MLDSMPNVTIGCPTYSGAKGVRRLFSSICCRTGYNGKIDLMVVDDGSPPGQAREIEAVAHGYGALLIKHESNLGIPSSWNSLVGTAKADYIVLINDDVEVLDKWWLDCLIGFIQENLKRGIKIGPVGLPTEPAMMPRMCYPISGWSGPRGQSHAKYKMGIPSHSPGNSPPGLNPPSATRTMSGRSFSLWCQFSCTHNQGT